MRIYRTSKDKILVRENNLVDVVLGSGERFEGLEPRRLFPVSSPTTYVTLLDGQGVERAVIKSLGDLDGESRRVIEDSLADYYLVPEIIRIINVVEKYGTLRWTVQTERGERSFDIRNRNHDIRVYPDGRVRVRDSDDNRYTIADWHNLDKKSRGFLIADL